MTLIGQMKKTLILLLFLPSIASAWGGTGHEIICEIAYQELSAEAQDEVRRLIELDPEFNTFAESCRWADRPRKRAPDHYINLPRSQAVITTDECPLAKSCLFPAIKKDLEILQDKTQSDQARLDALKLLGHWVGDIHQPLHVSFKDDLGGNNIDATGVCRGTLHGVWDGCILERQSGKDANAIASDLLTSITEDERRSWHSDLPAEWANESYQITLSPQTGYCTLKEDGCWYWPYIKTLEEGNLHREMIITQDYPTAGRDSIGGSSQPGVKRPLTPPKQPFARMYTQRQEVTQSGRCHRMGKVYCGLVPDGQGAAPITYST